MKTRKIIRKTISVFFTIVAIAGVMVAVGQADNTENEVAIRAIGIGAFAIGLVVASLTGGKEACDE